MKIVAATILSSLLALTACSSQQGYSGQPEHLKAVVKETYPFDEQNVVRGLESAGLNKLYVSSGQVADSHMSIRDTEGNNLVAQPVDSMLMATGATKVGDTVWQATGDYGLAIKRDAKTLEEIDRVKYSGDIWGMCTNSQGIITSDGTDTLRIMNKKTFEPQGEIKVTLNGQPYEMLDELECDGNNIYANLLASNDIARIDSRNGAVSGVIDTSDVPDTGNGEINNTLNGIAKVGDKDFYLTGKRWDTMYLVNFEKNN